MIGRVNAKAGPERERAGGRAVIVMLGAIVVLAGGGYLAAYLVASEKVPHGTTVAGVAIGGRSEVDAIRILDDGLAERAGRNLEVITGSVTSAIAPADLGLSVDLEESVAEAGGGRSWRPQRLWDYFTGGDDLAPVVAVDETAFATGLTRLDQQVSGVPVDGAVAFVDGRVQVTDAVPGASVNPALARDLLTAAFLDSDDPTVTLPMTSIAPDIDAADVEQAVTSFANPAVSAPVTLDFGDTPIRLQPRDYVSALSMRAEGGVLVPAFDETALAGLVASATAGTVAPVDATISIIDGRPKVTKGKAGLSFDPPAVTAAFATVLPLPDGQRQVAVAATVARPAFSTLDAQALRIKEKVSEFTTYFPYADYRNVNIGRAAELVNGTVLKPGETFSLNDTVGERTRENGFTDGFVISNGIFKEDLGGGVSQMATTTFNAMFFAGLEDIEHKPHSFYIDRYPVGREATVAWGAIDLRFRDDTDYGVLIDAHVTPSTPSSQGVVTVSMWSTKTWDIETSTSARYNPTQPDTRTLSTDDCFPNTGYGGFDVDVTRVFKRPGSPSVDKQETFTTTYTPSDTVICKPPPAASDGG